MSGPKTRDARAKVRALRTPVARSRRLDLVLPDRRFTPEILRLMNDRTLARWTLRIPFPYRERDAREFFARWAKSRRTGATLALHVVRRSDGALVGGAGLHDIDPEHLRAEVGYWIGRPYRHQGYATETTRAVCRLAFTTLGLYRIEAGVFPGNRASMGVLRASGFRREGRMRGTVRKNGAPTDVLLYARLRDDPVPGAPSGAGPARRGRRAGAVPTR